MFNIILLICIFLLVILLYYSRSLITTLYIFTIYISLSGYYLLSVNADLFSGFL